MHIMITDFGTAKIIEDGEGHYTHTHTHTRTHMHTQMTHSQAHKVIRMLCVCVCVCVCLCVCVCVCVHADRANSFVGTAEYVSPELLQNKVAFKSSDLWALGCIIYQFLAGRPPFHAPSVSVQLKM